MVLRGAGAEDSSMTRGYNAAVDLVERNLAAGRAGKAAFIDRDGVLTYGDLAVAVRRMAGAFLALGLQPGDRVLLCLADGRAFPIAFLGAIWAGLIPVPVNTMLDDAEYRWLLADSAAAAVVVSADIAARWHALAKNAADISFVCDGAGPFQPLERLLADAPDDTQPVIPGRDQVAFWLYTSGSTGPPKAAMHTHEALRATADLYAVPIAGYRENDVILSVAKLFFAYGLGNSLTFPLSCGATAVLWPERVSAEAVAMLIERHRVTILCGVPSLFARWLAAPDLVARMPLASLRLGISAGEPLSAALCTELSERLGIDVIDGLGSTELLHIFVSQPPGDVRAGVTGRAVPGYELRVVDADGVPLPAGMLGQLEARGPTGAIGYWRQETKSRATFRDGGWVRTGDQCRIDADGWCHFAGRADDMMKVNGMFVSPAEVEDALATHPGVLEAAVVGVPDAYGLTMLRAHVVLRVGHSADAMLADELVRHVRARIAGFKCPQTIRFADDLPRTATGKVQRFRLRSVD